MEIADAEKVFEMSLRGKFMKLTRIALAMFLVLGLSACETIDTPDGKIPSQYLDAAKPLVGTYQGHFNHVSGEFALKLDGDTPVLTYTDATGHDLLGSGCGAVIGKMTQVGISNDKSVGSARFELDPGKCNIEGHTVGLEFNQKSDGVILDVSIVRGHREYWVPGEVNCWPDGHGHVYCNHYPGHMETVFDTINGQFRKAN
jgi:hypothetical protein